MIIKSYFDLLKVLGKSGYDEVSAADKGRHLFMINRHLCRLYPEIAATFSHLKTNPVSAMDFWHNFFKGFYAAKRDPLPAKINFAKLSQAKKKQKFNEEGIEFIVSKMRLGSAEVQILKDLKADELIKYLKSVDELLNEKVKK